MALEVEQPMKLERLNVSRVTFPFRCDVGSVRQWMWDIRTDPEQECTSMMEFKPIPKPVPNRENVAATLKETIYKVQSIKDDLFLDLTKIYRNHREGSNHQLRPFILSFKIKTRASLFECAKLCPDLPNIQLEQQKIMEKMTIVGRCYDNLDERKQSSEFFIKSLTSLGEGIKAHLEDIQAISIRKMVQMVKGSAGELRVKFGILTLHGLAQDGVWLRRLLIQEGGMKAMLRACRSESVSMHRIPGTALEVVSILCTEKEGREELEKIGGIGVLSDILSSPTSIEMMKREAASVVAEITSPDRVPCFEFIEYMEDLLRSLTALCKHTSNPSVFLVATTAIANITYMDAMASDSIEEFGTAEVLIKGYNRGLAPSIYSKRQVITIIANISSSRVCREQIIGSGGMAIIADLLHVSECATPPISRRLSFESANFGDDSDGYEDIHQKSIIALGRLCQDKETCKLAVNFKVVSRLVELCKRARDQSKRNEILVACLATLRRIHSHLGATSLQLNDNDVEQLIEPRFMQAYLDCSGTASSARRETLV